MRHRNPQLIAHIDTSIFGALVLVLFAYAATGMNSAMFHTDSVFHIPHWKSSKLYPGANDKGALLVAVTRDTSIYFGSERVSLEDFAASLKLRHCLSDGNLYIRADSRTPYGLIMELVDSAHAAGIRRVVFLEREQRGTIFEECCTNRGALTP